MIGKKTVILYKATRNNELVDWAILQYRLSDFILIIDGDVYDSAKHVLFTDLFDFIEQHNCILVQEEKEIDFG